MYHCLTLNIAQFAFFSSSCIVVTLNLLIYNFSLSDKVLATSYIIIDCITLSLSRYCNKEVYFNLYYIFHENDFYWMIMLKHNFMKYCNIYFSQQLQSWALRRSRLWYSTTTRFIKVLVLANVIKLRSRIHVFLTLWSIIYFTSSLPRKLISRPRRYISVPYIQVKL